MAWRSQILRFGAFLVVLTPFGLSIAAHAISSVSEPVMATPRPSLRFAEYLLPLGQIEGNDVHGVFHFENTGDQTLTIQKVAPSCGCLAPKLPKKTYAPGERGKLLVFPDTAGIGSDEGDTLKEYFIDVTYDAGDGPRQERVHIKFILPPRRIVVEPRGLLIMQGDSASTRREITVTDRRANPVSVREVHCQNENVDVEWKAAANANDPTRATISVTIPPATNGEYATFVAIEFDDPSAHPIRVPIIVKALGGSDDRANVSPFLTPVTGRGVGETGDRGEL